MAQVWLKGLLPLFNWIGCGFCREVSG